LKNLILRIFVIYFVSAGYALASNTADSNNNGEITEREFLNFKSLAFNAIDKNYDAKLTQDEIRKSYLEKYQETMKQAFRDLDENKDGRLIAEDLLEQYRDFNSDELMQSQDDTFDLIDENGNNNISRLEYDQFVRSQIQDSIYRMEEFAADAFKGLDLDNDGYVDEKEYVYQGRDPNADAFENQNPFSSSNGLTGVQEKRVKRDGNGDGIITKSEDVEFNKYTFLTLDTDNNGALIKSESPYLFIDSDFAADGFLDFMYLGSEVQRLPRE